MIPTDMFLFWGILIPFLNQCILVNCTLKGYHERVYAPDLLERALNAVRSGECTMFQADKL